MSRCGSMILCYHRVAETNEDPFWLCVTPGNFAAHLEEIVRHCEPSTLDEVDLPSRRPRAIVTLDDGYADNLTNALPIAEAKGVPITVFVTSGMIDAQRGFWWDRLGKLLSARPTEIEEIRLPASGGTVAVRVGSSDANADRQSVRRHLLPLPVDEIHHVLDGLAEDWGTSATPPAGARTMTTSELLDLASSDTVTIGAHTTDHVCLSSRSAPEQQETISASKQRLERLTGQPVRHFAYPFGGPESFDEDSVEAVRAAGFDTACTTVPANARSTSDRYRLPRRLVMDWPRHRFKISLMRWKLMTRR
jgi:peptidoglycan/xylan/chitin deacetylase (PgdA/CDA1 family)